MSGVPGYWRSETSGVLWPAIGAYLRETLEPNAPPMTLAQIAAMRAYLRQWIMADVYSGPMIDALRTQIDDLTTQEDIERWLDRAADEGIDPL